MIARILRRLAAGAFTVGTIYTLTFLMVITIPGNPLRQGSRNLPPEAEQALRLRYNMDDNWDYFWEFLYGAVRGDFGPSFMYADWTCGQIIAASLPVSILIGFLAILCALIIGVPLGVIGAARKGGGIDILSMGIAILGLSMPTFVAGSVLLILFAVYLPIAPIGGWGTLAHLPLPVLTLALPYVVYIARLMRSGMLEVLGSDFIRTAVAKGLPPRAVLWKHAFKPAFLPILGFLGPASAQAMTGSFVVEKVFGVPGIGQHFVNAALNRDPGLILSTVLVFSTLLVLLNLAVDLLASRMDPRITEAV